MRFGIRKRFKILAPGNSLQKRVGYSLAFARLILVPVIFLAVYYLFEMGWIIDRIVNTDAPAAAGAQQASIEMLEARRAERNYLLLHDPAYTEANRQSIRQIKEMLGEIKILEPQDSDAIGKAMDSLELYEKGLGSAVAATEQPGSESGDPVRVAVKAYEKDLDDLLRTAKYKRRSQLVDELRKRVGSFDVQVSETAQERNPALQQVSGDLQSSSQQVLTTLSELEAQNWKRVEWDHRHARTLLSHAEWALSIVSALTLLFSVWVSFVLPRQVVKPLVSLREAVDHAAHGENATDLDVEGKGEVAELALSVRNLIARLQQAGEVKMG